jgi:hypothetical protein
MSPLSFPPTRRGRDNLTWPRFAAVLLGLGALLFVAEAVMGR